MVATADLLEEEEDEEPGQTAAKKKNNKKKKKKQAKKDGEEDGATEEQCQGGYPPEPPPVCNEDPEPGEEEWVDVSDTFFGAAGTMATGQMLASPSFRLYDAMSAIEIMDPKMDSGFDSQKDMTIERAVKDAVVSTSLAMRELAGLCDVLLMYYIMWMEGHTIAQTCFCCIYLHDIEGYVKPQPLLGAFIDAYLLVLRTARAVVLRGGVFDDEDFFPNLFGFELDAQVYSLVPDEILRHLREQREKVLKSSDPFAEAVSSRFSFMEQYLATILRFQEEFDPTTVPENGKKKKSSSKQQSTSAVQLEKCLRTLEKLQTDALEVTDPVWRCFDASVNRSLLVPGPPRCVVPVKDPKVFWGNWTAHIHELLLCDALAEKSFVQIMEGAITHQGDPNILPRSFAQLSLSRGTRLRDLVLDSLEGFMFPPDATQHCKRHVDIFLDHCESMFAHMLKLTHANKARRFRRLARVFHDFNTLQHEAFQLDEDLKKTFGANLRHPRPCWTWIMEQTLQAMLKKLFLGFQLDLYDDGELHMIYWYADYLCGLRVYNNNELQHAKESELGSGKKKTAGKPQQQPRGGQRPKNPPPGLHLLEATQHCLRGLFRLFAFCLKRGYISPLGGTEDLAQRFVLRFRSLEHFRLPHLPSFGDFMRSVASTQVPADSRIVLEQSQASFLEAGSLIDKYTNAWGKDKEHPDVLAAAAREGLTPDSGKAVKRVVVANQLALMQLLKGIDGGKSLKVTASTAHHPFLVSVQVQAAAA
eukprot:TRINITY_DN123459_c0_g1_i1.p1 TRINITY_DN123459_c0_g1~~TRINITY_DN123459_c0_g1_i1.p1  ORF type:complete len:756 (-),score=218.86 TRINITY_DN123459_c0_g1_i1:282-2549(-)